jgi:hypothetical protein
VFWYFFGASLGICFLFVVIISVFFSAAALKSIKQSMDKAKPHQSSSNNAD